MLDGETSPSGEKERGGKEEGVVLLSPPHPTPRGAHSIPLRLERARRVPLLTSEQPGPETSHPAVSAENFPLSSQIFRGGGQN